MTNKTYFTKVEALEDIKNVLENGYDGYGCDLHNEVFNTDYYIIGTNRAKKALEQYGVFEAIEEVQEYEVSNFGEKFTDVSNPEKLANMLYYVIGEKAIAEINNNTDVLDNAWNDELSDGDIKTLIEVIDKLIAELQ